METHGQRERAELLRRWHHEPPLLVLPNVWDAASARIVAQAGARALATTSSGIAAALGYRDGQRISRDQLIAALERVTRVVECPVSADIEAGYGTSLDEVLETVRAVIATGAVGINIEDSRPGHAVALVAVADQVALIRALRGLAVALEVPFVINARTDVFLRAAGEPADRLAQAVRRGNAYLDAGADCVYPIGNLDGATIAALVRDIAGPVNILGGPPQPPLAELARLGVARVSLGGRVMAAVLGRLRQVARELLEDGSYASLTAESLSSAEFSGLFAS